MVEALRSRHFGQVLRAYRHEQKPVLAQKDLAARLNMTQAQISRIENARRPPNDLDKLQYWARALNVPASCLWFALPTPTQDPPAARAEVGMTAGSWFTSAPAASPRPVEIDVDSIRTNTASFRKLDNQFGGGRARDLVSAYLAKDVIPALHGRHSSTQNREVVSAVVELKQLAGWMAYDVGDATSGRRHLQRAFQLCQGIGEDALAAEMLAGMSHQSAHAQHGMSAVNLARAARETAIRADIPALEAETALMEAHGLALTGDKRGCLTALQDAETAFAAPVHTPVPAWLSYFDAAYFAAKAAHCFRELGDFTPAERCARRSLKMSDGYDRGRLFNTALLASILFGLGKVDEACAAAREAIHLASSLDSHRCTSYLQDVAARLRQHQAVPEVAELRDEMELYGLVIA